MSPSRPNLNTPRRGSPRLLLSQLRRLILRPMFGRPIPRVLLVAVRWRKMEGTAEVYTAMILAATGRSSVGTIGQEVCGTTILLARRES